MGWDWSWEGDNAHGQWAALQEQQWPGFNCVYSGFCGCRSLPSVGTAPTPGHSWQAAAGKGILNLGMLMETGVFPLLRVFPAGSTDLLCGTGVGAVGAGNICSARVLHRAGEDAWGCVGFPGAREELGSAVAVVPARPCAVPSRAGAALCRCSGMRPC